MDFRSLCIAPARLAGAPLLCMIAAVACAGEAGIVAHVATVEERAERLVRTYPGRVVPVALANVRAQVSGEILEVCFSNGTAVAQKQQL